MITKVKTTSLIDKLSILILIIFFSWFSIKCVSIALTQPFSFDGALNAQVPVNLITIHKYAASYPSIIAFDEKIQTGITVLLPVAVLFKIFGISFSNGLMVNAIYMILLGLALIYYLADCLKINLIFVSFAFLIFWATPAIMNIGFGLYGEIPALFYFMLALIIYAKNNNSNLIFFAGLSMGLGYLTKTVILISLPAFIFVMAIDFFQTEIILRKSKILQFLFFFLGLFLPIICFELFKVISLGFQPYFQWWYSQSRSISAQAGITDKFSDTVGIINKLSVHLSILSKSVNYSIGIVISVIIILFFFFIKFSIYNIRIIFSPVEKTIQIVQNHFLILPTVSLSYFGWWLLITPTQKAWYRRIIDGTILAEISLVIILYLVISFIASYLTSKKKPVLNNNPFLKISSTLLLFITFFGVNSSINMNIDFSQSALKNGYLKAGEYIKTLPKNAKFSGFGWWQAPNISFTSGKHFVDLQKTSLEKINNKIKVYIVTDNYVYTIDPSSIEFTSQIYPNKITYQDEINKITIYQIIKNKK